MTHLQCLPTVQEAGYAGVHAGWVAGLPDEEQLVTGLVADADNADLNKIVMSQFKEVTVASQLTGEVVG